MSRLIKIADWGGEKRGNVVFVHGLGGHPYDTWRRHADDGRFWPLWVAQDIKGLAVYSLGYQSPPTNWIGTAMPLLDEAAHALRVLANSTVGRNKRIAPSSSDVPTAASASVFEMERWRGSMRRAYCARRGTSKNSRLNGCTRHHGLQSQWL